MRVSSEPVPAQANGVVLTDDGIFDRAAGAITVELDGIERETLDDCSVIYDRFDTAAIERRAPNGALMWRTEAPSRSTQSVVPSTVLVESFPPEEEGLAGLSTQDGSVLWTSSESSYWTAPDADALMVQGEESFGIFDAATLEERVTVPSFVQRVWRCGQFAWLAVRPQDGEPRHELVDLVTGATLAVEEGVRSVVTFPSGFGTSVAMSGSGGSVLFPDCSDPSERVALDVGQLGPVVTQVGDSLAADTPSGVVGLDLDTGQQLWAADGMSIRGSTSSAVVLASEGVVTVVDAQTGDALAEFTAVDQAIEVFWPPFLESRVAWASDPANGQGINSLIDLTTGETWPQ